METITKILLFLSVSMLLGNSGGIGDGNPLNDSATSATPSLLLARSSPTMERQFKASLAKQYGTFEHQRGVFHLASGEASPSATPGSFSTTALQESHVDESDRLKTDGRYIYISSINKPSIKIFEAYQGRAALVAELPIKTLNDGVMLSGLYLRPDKKQLVAIAGDGSYGGSGSWFSAAYWDDRRTELSTVDISSPTEPKQLSKLILDGQLISSRRIGSVLYVATRHTAKAPDFIEYPENQIQAMFNRAIIANMSMDALLPKYEINDEKRALFDAKDCFYTGKQTSSYAQHSIISLLAINLDDATSAPTGQCFIGNAETVYASANAIYLATTQYQYSDASSDVIYEGSPTTEIHKFALDGMQTDYSGSASIEGHLGWKQSQKSFRMSEENGILRVLSYVGEQADSIDSPARLHVLKESDIGGSLDIIATLPNSAQPAPLGKKGEQIYASRFIGDRGYLVTFRTTDPLYILDLSDPYNPYILSALEVDGYSDLLLPISENFLLGIGKDAIAQTQSEADFGTPEGAWYQGVKLSIIDIRNPALPVEKQTITLGKRGSETAASITHHAVTTLLMGNTLQVNIPVSLHENAINNYSTEPHPSDHFGWTQDALHRWNIDTISGEVSALKPIIAKMKDVPEDAEYYFDTGWQHDRSVIIDGDAYYLKRDEIFTLAD